MVNVNVVILTNLTFVHGIVSFTY